MDEWTDGRKWMEEECLKSEAFNLRLKALLQTERRKRVSEKVRESGRLKNKTRRLLF